MRINQGKDFTVLTDPLSYVAGLSVSGTLLQAYDQENKTYSPSRAVTPLLIIPWVKVVDRNDSSYNGTPSFKVDYYVGNPDDNIKVFDAIPSTRPYNVTGLEIGSNISPDSPLEITAVITVADPRTGDTDAYRYEKTLRLTTQYFVAHQWRCGLNQPPVRVIDPTRWTRDDNDNLPVTLTCTLYDNDSKVTESESNVAFRWQYLDADSGWSDISSECHWLMTEEPESGHFGGTIIVNGDCFDSLKIRCYAMHYADVDGYPTTFISGQFAECYLKRQLPKTAWADTIIDKGSYINNPNSNGEIKMHVAIHDNQGEITNVDKYYRVQWWAKKHITSTTSTTTETKIGEGCSLTTKVSDLGITRDQGVNIYPIIYELGAFLPIQAGVGQTVTGFTVPILLTTSNGSFIVAQKIKS